MLYTVYNNIQANTNWGKKVIWRHYLSDLHSTHIYAFAKFKHVKAIVEKNADFLRIYWLLFSILVCPEVNGSKPDEIPSTEKGDFDNLL